MRTILSVSVFLLLSFLSLTSGQNCPIGSNCKIDNEVCCGENAWGIGDPIDKHDRLCGCKFGYRPARVSDANETIKPEVDCIKIECHTDTQCLDYFQHSVCSNETGNCDCDVGYYITWDEICRVDVKPSKFDPWFLLELLSACILLTPVVWLCICICGGCCSCSEPDSVQNPARTLFPVPNPSLCSNRLPVWAQKPSFDDNGFVIPEPPPKYTP